MDGHSRWCGGLEGRKAFLIGLDPREGETMASGGVTRTPSVSVRTPALTRAGAPSNPRGA